MSIQVRVSDRADKFLRAHIKHRKKEGVSGADCPSVVDSLIECYEKHHCPECGAELPSQTCSCKASERF